MKNFDVSRESWHYNFVSKFDSAPDNMCEYIIQVIKGIALVLAIGFIAGGVIAAVLGDLIGYLFACLVTHTLLPLSEAGMTEIGILVTITAINDKIWTRKFVSKQQSPSFIKQAYRSWKDKYCIKINFKD